MVRPRGSALPQPLLGGLGSGARAAHNNTASFARDAQAAAAMVLPHGAAHPSHEWGGGESGTQLNRLAHFRDAQAATHMVRPCGATLPKPPLGGRG